MHELLTDISLTPRTAGLSICLHIKEDLAEEINLFTGISIRFLIINIKIGVLT